MKPISRALMSVTDKGGLLEFAQFLAQYQVEILSTGGTAKMLREGGVKVVEVSDYTGFPEMLDGRVKTLHPKIHGGILGRRDLPAHLEQMAAQKIQPIDLVVVNLYQFEKAVAQPGCTLEDAIENIDIGGPTLLRAAAKNYAGVTVVVDPGDYHHLMEEIKLNKGATNLGTRFRLARKVFQLTSAYDGAISRYLEDKLAC
ncbi:MAG: IMP cyclohydrolase [Deltaproteobacteria bacterium RBG_13_60_28]|nr:MAG: IMP cyclohydrolase [Deltaproteobacteria bacterium RBG_13_60_28]